MEEISWGKSVVWCVRFLGHRARGSHLQRVNAEATFNSLLPVLARIGGEVLIDVLRKVKAGQVRRCASNRMTQADGAGQSDPPRSLPHYPRTEDHPSDSSYQVDRIDG